MLANDRTLLAYLRTALALLLAGVTFLHFAQAIWFSVVGVACLVVGLIVLPFAVWRYRQMHSELAPLRVRIGDAKSSTPADCAEPTAPADRQAFGE